MPSSKLSVFGITGTNGKTSCGQFIAQTLTALDYKCGVIGTLGYGICGELKETQLTTPDAVFTQMALAEMVLDSIDPVVMEVSSVGLHQKRVKAVHFDTAIFTNLTRDHLDYHETFEQYLAAKERLFRRDYNPGIRFAVVNGDDPYGRKLVPSRGVERVTFGIEDRNDFYPHSFTTAPDAPNQLPHKGVDDQGVISTWLLPTA